jgi:hypothetical protein
MCVCLEEQEYSAKLRQNSRCSGQNSNLTPPEYDKVHRLNVALLKQLYECELGRNVARLKNGEFHPILFPLIVKGNDGCKPGDIRAKMC